MIRQWGMMVAGLALAAGAGQAQQAAPDAERARQIAQCAGHKFETYVIVDPAGKNAKRIRLCANPGASDADWVTTLKSAKAQVALQPFSEAAKEQLAREIDAEIAKFDKGPAAPVAATAVIPAPPPPSAPAGGLVLDPGAVRGLDAPPERFETSRLPTLDHRTRTASAGGAAAAAPAVPLIPMRARVTCLEPGERGAGMTCDFLRGDTVLLLKAQAGMEKGARVRFLRKGEQRGEILLSALAPGDSVRVRLPADLCRGVKATKVELQLLPTDSRGRVAGSLGPFGLRC